MKTKIRNLFLKLYYHLCYVTIVKDNISYNPSLFKLNFFQALSKSKTSYACTRIKYNFVKRTEIRE